MTKRAVSACLLGKPCRYDGGSKPHATVAQSLGDALPVCPECLGGLPIPRAPSEIQGGDGADVLAGRARVMSRDGQDVTEAFLKGAKAALQLCREAGVQEAVLKARSPSCGVGAIYDGGFSGHCRPGDGVTAALLRANGIRVRTEEDQIRE